jgi:hypothetical protein
MRRMQRQQKVLQNLQRTRKINPRTQTNKSKFYIFYNTKNIVISLNFFC